MDMCLNCGQNLNRHQFKYCSNLCQSKKRQLEYIEKWQSGTVNGSRGLTTKNISKHLKHFLEEKFGNKCSLCGWNEINPTTGRVPLEIDHINGSAEDNREENLRIICPNCHSLSPNFRNLNKGQGRTWRTKKYLKNSLT